LEQLEKKNQILSIKKKEFPNNIWQKKEFKKEKYSKSNHDSPKRHSKKTKTNQKLHLDVFFFKFAKFF
jgi:hypothetical protein